MKYNFRKLFGKEAIICTLTILWVLLVSLGLTYGCFMVTMADHSFILLRRYLCQPRCVRRHHAQDFRLHLLRGRRREGGLTMSLYLMTSPSVPS